MAEAHSSDLNYGHLGDPWYDFDSHEWEFPRRPIPGPHFNVLGSHRTAISSPLAPPLRDSQHQRTFNIKLEQVRYERKRLARAYVQTAPVPAEPFLQDLIEESEAVEGAALNNDPTKSRIFAFGLAKAVKGSEPKIDHLSAAKIVVTAGGPSGEWVRIIKLEGEEIGWRSHRAPKLHALSIDHREEMCIWAENNGPVQQLCFSPVQREEVESMWLAVRYPGLTAIIYPVFYETATSTKVGHSSSTYSDTRRPSRLGVRHIANLPVERSGGFAHVDVSFNPWTFRQFAVIDRRGSWSIWNIQRVNVRGRQSKRWRIVEQTREHLYEHDGGDPDPSFSSFDGFGKILWVKNPSLIAVFGRKRFLLCYTAASPTRCTWPDLGLKSSADLFIDAIPDPTDTSRLYVVTSSRVFWIETQLKDEDANPKASVLLSWRHFRDGGDLTLQLRAMKDENDTKIFLYSRLASITQVFTFGQSDSTSSRPISVCDPCTFPLPIPPPASSTRGRDQGSPVLKGYIDFITEPLKYFDGRSAEQGNGPGAEYEAKGVRFFQFYGLGTDLSLITCLYTILPSGEYLEIEPPDSRQPMGGTNKLLLASSKMIKDNFIVADCTELEDGGSHRWQRRAAKLGAQVVDEEVEFGENSKEPFDLGWVEGASDMEASMSIDDYMTTLEAAANDQAIDGSHRSTSLLEMINQTFSISDIDAFQDRLQHFLSVVRDMPENDDDHTQHYPDEKLKAVIMLMPASFGGVHGRRTMTEEDQSLTDLYDNLMENWMLHLPSSVSNHVRVALDRRIRNIASELFLAGHGVWLSPEPLKQDDVSQVQDSLMEYETALPVKDKSSMASAPRQNKGKARDSSADRQLSPLLEGEAQAGAGDGVTNGIRPTSEPAPNPKAKADLESNPFLQDPACRRLKALVNLAAQPILPKPAQNLLRHWADGADPAEYDWERVQQSLELEQEEESEEEDRSRKRQPKQKKLHQKKASEPRRKSQADSTSLMSFPTAIGSQPQPPRVGSGQPTSLRVPSSQPQSAQVSGALSSSQAAPSFASTQEERGKHGSRKKIAASGKPKPKRKAGF